MKHMGFLYGPEDKKAAALEELTAEGGVFQKFTITLSDKCLGDTKYLCGDTLTIHDFMVGGTLHNMVSNPHNQFMTPKFKERWDASAPERLKTYLTDF